MKSLLVVLFLWSLAISQMFGSSSEVLLVGVASLELSKSVALKNLASAPQFLDSLGLEFNHPVAPVILACDENTPDVDTQVFASFRL